MSGFALPPSVGMQLVERYLLDPVGEPPVVALHAQKLPALAGETRTFPDPFAPKKKDTGRRERNVQVCARQTPTGRQREGFEWSPEARKRKLIIVASSGGIDSTALLIRTRRKYPRAMLLIERADTGHEPPDTLETMREVARVVRAPIVNLEPDRSLWEHIRDRGEIPNLAKAFQSCTLVVKGQLLDKFNCWLVRNRKNRTTIHLSGLLYEEPSRVYGQLFSQDARFGELMQEEALLYDEKITKAGAIKVLQEAGIPISSTYLDRLRHGCIPCKYWSATEWKRYFQVDPSGFKEASDLEQYIAKHGRRKGTKRFPAGSNFGKLRRIWLVGRKDIAPEGLYLTEWVQLWDREDPGWRTRPVPAGLIRPEDISADFPWATRTAKVGSKRLPVMGDFPLPATSPAVAKRESKRAKKGAEKWHKALDTYRTPRKWQRALKDLKAEQGQRNVPFPLPPELDVTSLELGSWSALPAQTKPRWSPPLKLWSVKGPRTGLGLWVWKAEPNWLVVRLKEGRKWVGHVSVTEQRSKGQTVWVVGNSHLKENLRGTGLGSLLYLATKQALEAYRFKPVKMIPTSEYLGGTGTSPQAGRVWTRLRGEGRLARYAHRGVVPYVSPRMRRLTKEEAANRKIAYGLKEGHGWAVRKATRAMSPHVRSSDLLVPIPNSRGDTAANLKLATALAKATGAEVWDVLGRAGTVESNRERHIAGRPPLTIMQHSMTRDHRWDGWMWPLGPTPICPDSIVFIDNVVSSGSTFDAARHQLHGGWGLAFADARGSWRGQGNQKRQEVMGLGYSSSEITKAIRALESTPSGRSSGPPGAVVGVPPVAVQRAALKGLKIRAQSPSSRQGGTQIGVGRAMQLALGQPISERSVRRMKSYFARHAGDRRPGWSKPGRETKGYQAWLLWGGDAGRKWVEGL